VLKNIKNNKFSWIEFHTMGQKFEIVAKNFLVQNWLFFTFSGWNQPLFGFFDENLLKKFEFVRKIYKIFDYFQKHWKFESFFIFIINFHQKSQKEVDFNQKMQKNNHFWTKKLLAKNLLWKSLKNTTMGRFLKNGSIDFFQNTLVLISGMSLIN
jgi:hypothetical protein